MSRHHFEQQLAANLEKLEEQSLRRFLRPLQSGQQTSVQRADRNLLNFSSNDYLGLASHPQLREEAMKALGLYGLGAGASRLVCGSLPPHEELETEIASWKNCEAALCFSSGYAAAVGTLPALATAEDVIILDKLVHASLVDGARLSGAHLRVFPHNDLARLQSHLIWARKKFPTRRILVVTESIFSMDGDRCPLQEIIALKNNFDAVLVLDEAHAVGVLGETGAGLAEEIIGRAQDHQSLELRSQELGAGAKSSPKSAQFLGRAQDHQSLELRSQELGAGAKSFPKSARFLGSEEVEVQMGTLSKAIGASGGYVCGSRSLIDTVINRSRSFIFSTAPPPCVAAAALAGLRIIRTSEGSYLRDRLWENIYLFSQKLKIAAQSAILPWLIGPEAEAVEIAQALETHGYLAPAIRYPSVAKDKARIRFTLSAAHTKEEINRLTQHLTGFGSQVS